MTTPERLKRRQLIEGAVLILLAVFTVLQGIYFNLEDRSQRACFEEKFTELSKVSKLRSELAERETAATSNVLRVYAKAAGLVKDDPTQELKPKDEARLQRELVAALLSYQDEITAIENSREKNPVPPYPIGVCE